MEEFEPVISRLINTSLQRGGLCFVDLRQPF